jgi:hypothetical protein
MPISNTPKQGQFPVWAPNGEDSTATFSRYMGIPTVEKLKARALFGIPLKSFLTGEVVSDDTLKYYIDAAISELEHELDLYITPVQFVEKHDYSRHEFSWSYNYTKLQHGNVLQVQKVELDFANNPTQAGFMEFPLEMVHIMHQEGVLQLVPATGTSLSGFSLASFGGSQFYALFQAGMTNFPGAVRITYTSGFEEGKIPAAIVELIENMAAYKILTAVGPLLFPYTSAGISIDGTSQSVGTPGPQFLAGRIKDLEGIIEKGKEAIKGYYQRRYQIDMF